MVPLLPTVTEPVVGLPETDSGMPGGESSERFLNGAIVFDSGRIMVATSWQSHNLTSLADTAPLFENQMLNGFFFLSRA